MEAGASARAALDEDQERGDGDQDQGDLRRALAISEPVPGAVDRRRECMDAVVLHRSKVGERLEEGQHGAGRDGRACQRQGHAPESSPRSMPQDATGLEQRLRLHQEGGARRQIDVGVEDEGEQEGHAACRAEVRKPVVAAPPTGYCAQGRLKRPRECQEIGVGIADDVGRQHQRQQKRPLQGPAAGKAAHGDEPGRPSADDGRAEPHAQQQNNGICDNVGELRLGYVAPQVALPRQKAR